MTTIDNNLPTELVGEPVEQNHDAHSMLHIVVSQFKEHRMAMAGFVTIVIFLLMALLAPLISRVMGINPDEQNVFKRYQPLFTTMEMSQDARENAIQKFIDNNPESARLLAEEALSNDLVPKTTTASDVLFTLVIDQESSAVVKNLKKLKSAPARELLKIVNAFSVTHILGTDELGRDVFIRLLYATQVSIGVGILVALAAAIIGLIMGTVGGYYGGIVDAVLSRITDSLLSLPILPLMIVFAAINLKELPIFKLLITGQSESVVKLIVILCLFSWMGVSRLVRGSVLSLKQREFILAAKTLGATDSFIMIRHIAPNVIAPLLVAVTLNVGNAILFESALSFLGLGIQPPTASWGNMLFNAQEIVYHSPALAILPGMLILLTTISFNFVGDGLQDAIDPKAIKR